MAQRSPHPRRSDDATSIGGEAADGQAGPARAPRASERAESAASGLNGNVGANLAASLPPNLAANLAVSLAANTGASEGLNAKVLVLNKMYTAMRVISARRAFCLLVNGICEVIHVDQGPQGQQFVNYDFESWAEVAQLQKQIEPDRHDWVRTVRYEIAVPRIVRLLGYDRLPEQLVKLNRRNLFARDRNQCQYCGRIFPTADLSIDHVKPRTQGGGNTWDNLVCACIKCNARKGGRTPEQAHVSLIRRPEKPKRNPLITLRLGHEKYASWKAFLDHAYWSVELK